MNLFGHDSHSVVSENKSWRLILVVFLAAFAVLRIAQIELSEIWLDEAITWHFTTQPWDEIADYVGSNDIHPPLYFVLAKLLTTFSDAPWALRLCGLIAEMLALPLIYLSAYMLAPTGKKRAIGLVALVLAGLSGNMISTALLARPYATLYLAFTVCFAALSWIVANAEAANKSIFRADGRSARLPFLALGLGLAAMPWLHNLGLFYSFSVAFVSVLVWCFVLKFSRAAFWNFFSAGAVALLLYLPHITVLLRQLEQVSSDYWIQEPTLAGLIRALLEVFGHGWNISAGVGVVAGLATLVCLLGVVSVVVLARQRKLPTLLVTVGLVATVYVVFFLVTYLIKPVMLNRSMYPMLGPWFVLLALTAGSMPNRVVSYAMSGFLIGFFALSTLNRTENVNWYVPFLKMIVDNATTTPTVVAVPNAAAIAIQYHVKQLGVSVNTVPLPRAYPAHDPEYFYATGWPGVPAIDESGLQAFNVAMSETDQDVWVYLRSHWIYDPDALLKAHLDQNFCYLPVDGTEKLKILLKLMLRNFTDEDDCTTMGEDDYFPYDRPDYGFIDLKDLSP